MPDTSLHRPDESWGRTGQHIKPPMRIHRRRGDKPYVLNTIVSATDPPLFLGIGTLSRSWGGEGKFSVSLGSVFGRFLSSLTEIDRTLTKNDFKLTPSKVFGGSVLLKMGEGL